MTEQAFGLPRPLGNGLLLRWATLADTDELADFNIHMHSDNPDAPETFLTHWTRDLMRGDHPTTSATDFTVVVDENKRGKIISSMTTISQTWAYDGIPFGVGRPELVATDPDYRRLGLVRAQFEVIHAKSAARGELVQGITGIPWYYRQFGYEMTLALHGGRDFYWSRPGNTSKVDEEAYHLRPATEADLPLLQRLHATCFADLLVTRIWDEAQRRYELFQAHRETPGARHVQLVETTTGETVAYVEYRQWGSAFVVRELGVLLGHSWRAVCLFLTRILKVQADELNQTREKPVDRIYFEFGVAHPTYEALGRQLEEQRPTYTWFIRVPDVPAFLRHLAPALNKRLAASAMAGHTGALRLSFYHSQLALRFEQGQLVTVEPYEPGHFFDCDAFFPDLTFLHVLFGHRSWEEIRHLRADCYPLNSDTAVLLNILFPKRPSRVLPLE